ncbi:MAG: hypothetical protein HQK65_01860 [Desulfamplus sp.]|nr:hypothetical protein [Desulfamplus sp.]
MKSDEVANAKERLKEAKIALKKVQKLERIRWKEEMIEDFKQKTLQKALESKTKKQMKIKRKAQDILDKAYSTVSKLFPDEHERNEFLSSYGKC